MVTKRSEYKCADISCLGSWDQQIHLVVCERCGHKGCDNCVTIEPDGLSYTCNYCLDSGLERVRLQIVGPEPRPENLRKELTVEVTSEISALTTNEAGGPLAPQTIADVERWQNRYPRGTQRLLVSPGDWAAIMADFDRLFPKTVAP